MLSVRCQGRRVGAGHLTSAPPTGAPLVTGGPVTGEPPVEMSRGGGKNDVNLWSFSLFLYYVFFPPFTHLHECMLRIIIIITINLSRQKLTSAGTQSRCSFAALIEVSSLHGRKCHPLCCPYPRCDRRRSTVARLNSGEETN